MNKGFLQVIENKPIADQVYLLTLAGDLVTEMTAPGQFLHLRCAEGIDPLLRRPISICDVDLEKKEVKIIFRAEGRGTKLLAESLPGERLDVLGPLGTGFPIAHRQAGERVLLVGGGVGVPPLYYLSKQLKEKGVEVTHILGFQSASNVFFVDEFSALGKTYVATDDGTYGRAGLVTQIINDWPVDNWDAMYSCGPIPMLRALTELFAGQEAYISLEQRMGCGIGACFACVCHTTEPGVGYKKICSDGPVFRLGEVSL